MHAHARARTREREFSIHRLTTQNGTKAGEAEVRNKELYPGLPHWHQKPKFLGHLQLLVQVQKKGVGSEAEYQDWNWHSDTVCWCYKRSLNHYTTMPVPLITLSFAFQFKDFLDSSSPNFKMYQLKAHILYLAFLLFL